MTDNPVYRGTMQGHRLVVLESDAPLPDGTSVEVRPLAENSSNSAGLLAAMEAEPHLTPDDIAELDRVIAAGQRPVAAIDLFEEK